MSANNKISRLSFATLLFPLALVLFEFAVYIANDMAQPAMLQVTREFGVDAGWVPLSMTFFLLGGLPVYAIVMKGGWMKQLYSKLYVLASKQWDDQWLGGVGKTIHPVILLG